MIGARPASTAWTDIDPLTLPHGGRGRDRLSTSHLLPYVARVVPLEGDRPSSVPATRAEAVSLAEKGGWPGACLPPGHAPPPYLTPKRCGTR